MWSSLGTLCGILWEFFVEFGNYMWNSFGVLCGSLWEFFVEFFGNSLCNSLGIFKELIYLFLCLSQIFQCMEYLINNIFEL